MDRAVFELKRVAKNSATFCIMVPNSRTIYWIAAQIFSRSHKESNENAYCLEEWQNFFSNYGFNIKNILVFATPVYFHHMTAQMKKLIDRFRSLVRITITETGLNHVPHREWNKEIVLISSLGSSSDIDAKPLIDLFRFMIEIMGNKSRLNIITGTRLAVSGQVGMDVIQLEKLYLKLGLSKELASVDAEVNSSLLQKLFKLGNKLSTRG